MKPLIWQLCTRFFSLAHAFALDMLFPIACAGCHAPDVALCPACAYAMPQAELQCIGCGSRNKSGEVCVACHKHLPALRRVLFVTPHTYPLMHTMVSNLKYRGHTFLAQPIAHLMKERFLLASHVSPPKKPLRTIVASVPLHSSRLRERGFNQSEKLAEHIARDLSLDTLPPNILIRSQKTPPQVHMKSREHRIQNVHGAFSILHAAPELEGARVLLVDDIATTGSTLNEAALALKHGGAKEIWGLVAAHG